MSIDENDDNISSQLRLLNSKQVYVFWYRQPHYLNPEIEETHRHIIGVTPLHTNLRINHKGVVKASAIEKKGGYSTGERRGKVILVQRWGFSFDIDCSFTLHVGGRGSSEFAPIFNVYSEEGCRFAEEVLKAGKDVIVKYSQDYIEIWDHHRNIAEEIMLVD